jgi:outer membrane protein OmpA-like peptidoglycan-associated protein
LGGYKLHGKAMLYFAGFKEQYSLFAASGTFFPALEDAAARPFLSMLDRYSTAALTENCISLGENAIHFATAQFSIPAGAEGILSEVANQLKANPDWNWEVEGYTDNVGDKAANQKLSDQRATAVANWLADHGIDRSHLTVKGYGESNPVADDSTPEGRARIAEWNSFIDRA